MSALAVQIIAAHQSEFIDGAGVLGCTECGWTGADDLEFAAHVVEEISKSGETIARTSTLDDFVNTLFALESWARVRIDDWNDETAKEVLDIIEGRSEWSANSVETEGDTE